MTHIVLISLIYNKINRDETYQSKIVIRINSDTQGMYEIHPTIITYKNTTEDVQIRD